MFSIGIPSHHTMLLHIILSKIDVGYENYYVIIGTKAQPFLSHIKFHLLCTYRGPGNGGNARDCRHEHFELNFNRRFAQN